MRTCVSEFIKKIGLSLQEDDAFIEAKRMNYTIENPVTSFEANPKAKLPIPGQAKSEEGSEGSEGSIDKPVAEISDKVRESKRPNIKPPRREESFKTKWKGEGRKETRNEYQKEYRSEHGNK